MVCTGCLLVARIICLKVVILVSSSCNVRIGEVNFCILGGKPNFIIYIYVRSYDFRLLTFAYGLLAMRYCSLPRHLE
jgi:hypothetical protein